MSEWGEKTSHPWEPERARREERLARIEAARRRLEAQAQAEAEAERQRRAAAEAERQRTGQKRRGKAPTPVQERPADKAQSNLTDPELHIMQTNNKGWEYGGNAQARVDGACQISLACDVTEASHDKQQAEPMAQAPLATLTQAGLERPKGASGAAHAIPATLDNGYDSAAAVEALETVGCDPSIAPGRQPHHVPQAEAPGTPATGQERMAAKGRTPAGKALYARRKVIVEPVFGQIKEARGLSRKVISKAMPQRGA